MTFYEDIKVDMRRELTKISEFLRVPSTNVDCALHNSEGNFHRKKKADYHLLYDKNLTALVEQSRREVYKEFSKHRVSCLHC